MEHDQHDYDPAPPLRGSAARTFFVYRYYQFPTAGVPSAAALLRGAGRDEALLAERGELCVPTTALTREGGPWGAALEELYQRHTSDERPMGGSVRPMRGGDVVWLERPLLPDEGGAAFLCGAGGETWERLPDWTVPSGTGPQARATAAYVVTLSRASHAELARALDALTAGEQQALEATASRLVDALHQLRRGRPPVLTPGAGVVCIPSHRPRRAD